MTEKETLQDRLEQNSGSMASYQHAQALEKINQLNMLLADLITQSKEEKKEKRENIGREKHFSRV